MRFPGVFVNLRLPLAFLPLLGLYLFCIVRFHIRDEIQVQTATALNIAVLLSGVVSIYVITSLVEILTPPRPLARFAASTLLVVAQVVLSTYHLRCHGVLDYKLLVDNLPLAFHSESLGLIEGIPKRDDYVLGVAAILCALVIQWRWSAPLPPPAKLKRRIGALLVIYFLCVRLFPYSYDELTSFAQSVYWYYLPPSPLFNVMDPAQKFPRVKELSNPAKSDPPQNVFVIMVESLNANFVKTRTPDGREYTPFLNRLTEQGLFFDNFWGNSIQTSKGQFAVLASTPPISKGKEISDYPELRLRCLPQIMKENGYDTVFFQGIASLHFEDTGTFMERNGFNHVHAMNSEFVSEEEMSRYRWGWGVQDDILYRKSFEFLDGLHQKELAAGKEGRHFVLLATISSHMKFKDVPKAQRYLYPEQQTKKQCYANAIRVTDEYLKTFFEELGKRGYLSNSVVFITSDHSFPVGEHKYFDSESSFYNEYFKAPLLIWGNGVTPGVSHDLHSQLDIAPTILELTGISARVHFTGKSVFSGAASSVPLIQPYAGTYFCILAPPYKYVYRHRGRQEFLFDLSCDPLEKQSIAETAANHPIYERLRLKASEIFENERLVKENRLWPGE